MTESRFEKPACSTKNAATPVEVECPHCGNALEIWSDENEILCNGCGKTVTLSGQ